MKNLLEIDGVILEFDTKRVLQDVYFKCETGSVTGILGRNGSGKSCLMNIIFGELEPFDKSIRLNGEALLTGNRHPGQIKYLPQFSFIPKSLTVRRIFRDFKNDFNDFIDHFPEFEKYEKFKLKLLSSGEQRIIEIYTILVSRTRFCMLDEPFSQVMPIHVDQIKELITREKRSKGIILTDHLYKHIIDICDSLYVLTNGKTYLTDGIQDIENLGYARIDNKNNIWGEGYE